MDLEKTIFNEFIYNVYIFFSSLYEKDTHKRYFQKKFDR
jgi:hypothetical protein